MTSGCSICAQRADPLRLVRTGTSQAQRSVAAPDAAGLLLDERRPEHAMVFASTYARHLPFVAANGIVTDTWEALFTADTSAQLAAAAVEDVGVYRTTVQELLHRLEDPELPASGTDMVEALGAVFDCVGTLARRLDTLKDGLPADEPLRATLANLVRSRLSPVLRQVIGFYRAGVILGLVHPAAQPLAGSLLGREIEPFDSLITGTGLSQDWPDGVGAPDWAAYLAVELTEPTGAYGAGPGATDVELTNHLATHNLFRAACETFLGGYARVVEDAGTALRASFGRPTHHPHYALFLAFLRLFDHARDELNAFTGNHLDFYYRRVLQLAGRPAVPSQAHVVAELAKHVDAHLLTAGTLLKAGKDVHFSLDRDLAANKATVAQLRSLYRHHKATDTEPLALDDGRLFASPVTNEGESWQPFTRKTFVDGRLRSIDMPPAEVGFAIASHHLWLAEGTRTVTLTIDPTRMIDRSKHRHLHVLLKVRLTTAKGWLERDVDAVTLGLRTFRFTVTLSGNDPAITPFDPAVHGYGFDTALPVLLVTLRHEGSWPWSYPLLADVGVESFTVTTKVDGIKTLALANDQGTIDPSKPFFAFGSTPTRDSSLVIGCKEAFQKTPTKLRVAATAMTTPKPYKTNPSIHLEYLNNGGWVQTGEPAAFGTTAFELGTFTQPPVVTPDLTPDVPYSASSRAGFIRLRLDDGFGTALYPVDLAGWVAHLITEQPTAPVLPVYGSITLGYDAIQHISPATPSEAGGRFFHVTPFGHAEQHSANPPLLPQFLAGANEPSQGEFYIGVQSLMPPQNLALLFQVVDGTANPLAAKPPQHVRWSYLHGNEWLPFPNDGVGDLTDGLLAPGIVTLAVPADADLEHTLLPRGLHWIRIAVASATDAVCRLLGVFAQAARATSTVPEGAATLTVDLPAGTITKLEVPDAAVKAVSQRYPTFGGRPVEDKKAFATRVSERLRHKDRAIALWDYEYLVLEAFPGIYQARCLNHTLYDPTTCAAGDYRELAPGHVTVVTIPDLAVPNPQDPLRPYTSLRVLSEITQFLTARMSCFATVHVRNPQFEEVKVALRVRLREGVDETYHLNRLRREITEFLSPWAFRADARPQFNGTVHKSVVVNFIEERPYVDYVADVQLSRKLPDAIDYEAMGDTVTGSRAISILVSVPAGDHDVSAIPSLSAVLDEDCGCAPEGAR